MLALVVGVPTPAAELPQSLAGIAIGSHWEDVADLHEFRVLSTPVTLPERRAFECGERTLVATTAHGELLVALDDFVVTALSLATAIERGRDVLEVAAEHVAEHGEPDQASLRDADGTVTIDPQAVNHVALKYEGEDPVTILVSGEAQWQTLVRIEYSRRSWHQNRSRRCRAESEAHSAGTSAPEADVQEEAADGGQPRED